MNVFPPAGKWYIREIDKVRGVKVLLAGKECHKLVPFPSQERKQIVCILHLNFTLKKLQFRKTRGGEMYGVGGASRTGAKADY